MTGLDIRVDHWFEVWPLGTLGITLTGTTPSVTLTWTNDGADSAITKWQVRHSADGNFQANDSDWTDIASSGAGTASYTPTVTDFTTAHFWQVRPSRGDVPGHTVDQTDLTVTASAALTWADPGNSDIVGYQYPDSTVGGATWEAWTDISGSSDTSTTHTVDGLDLSPFHAFEVRAVGLPDRDPVELGPLQIENFNGIRDWETLAHSGPDSNSKLSGTVTGLVNRRPYYFRIRAVTDGGNSGASNTANAKAVLGPPAAPTGLTATPSSTVTQVILTWNDPDNTEITGYQYRDTTTGKAVLTWAADSGATGWEYHHSVDGGDNYGDWMDTGIAAAEAATATTTTITEVNPS